MLPVGSAHQETCGGVFDGDGEGGVECKKKGAKVGRKCIQQSSRAGGGNGWQSVKIRSREGDFFAKWATQSMTACGTGSLVKHHFLINLPVTRLRKW